MHWLTLALTLQAPVPVPVRTVDDSKAYATLLSRYQSADANEKRIGLLGLMMLANPKAKPIFLETFKDQTSELRPIAAIGLMHLGHGNDEIHDFVLDWLERMKYSRALTGYLGRFYTRTQPRSRFDRRLALRCESNDDKALHALSLYQTIGGDISEIEPSFVKMWSGDHSDTGLDYHRRMYAMILASRATLSLQVRRTLNASLNVKNNMSRGNAASLLLSHEHDNAEALTVLKELCAKIEPGEFIYSFRRIHNNPKAGKVLGEICRKRYVDMPDESRERQSLFDAMMWFDPDSPQTLEIALALLAKAKSDRTVCHVCDHLVKGHPNPWPFIDVHVQGMIARMNSDKTPVYMACECLERLPAKHKADFLTGFRYTDSSRHAGCHVLMYKLGKDSFHHDHINRYMRKSVNTDNTESYRDSYAGVAMMFLVQYPDLVPDFAQTLTELCASSSEEMVAAAAQCLRVARKQ
jgi:hypothetical protein